MYVWSQILLSFVDSPLPHTSSSGSFTDLIERIMMRLSGSLALRCMSLVKRIFGKIISENYDMIVLKRHLCVCVQTDLNSTTRVMD